MLLWVELVLYDDSGVPFLRFKSAALHPLQDKSGSLKRIDSSSNTAKLEGLHASCGTSVNGGIDLYATVGLPLEDEPLQLSRGIVVSNWMVVDEPDVRTGVRVYE